MHPKIIAVSHSETYTFTKPNVDSINLLAGLGVEGDAHCGKTMKHRSRLKLRPIPPNLRQVHLIHSELFEELKTKGFEVTPGLIGENAMVEITGLRNPCSQLDHLQSGLLTAVLDKDEEGNLIRKSGIMGIVLEGGVVKPGDEIRVELPAKPFLKLERV